MCLAENKWGYVLLDFIKITEKEMLENDLYRSITGSLILVKCNDKYLIAFNKWRNQWEIAAGGIEQGETPRECVERELLEETNQKVENIEFKGMFKLHDKHRNIIKYQAMYYACINKLEEFVENDEMDKIMLWDLQTHIGDFDEVDRKMIELCLIDKTL
ncbi:NUDIX domain-containing protein [Clostridium algidicarnis]|uniref:NUDIX domain-containing protein n=1 Tax=Clostridium algidicarnis TaxID=37659 RepID=UPI001C0E66B0|nr:NUDIX hydrolase [Clostridium algidicarnis]MBU3227786.1 NUDIX hydrolase [Clostridium algidicarnis]MBU3251537.1 NUDIX hydrolase [Clostridium algidicarnis]